MSIAGVDVIGPMPYAVAEVSTSLPAVEPLTDEQASEHLRLSSTGAADLEASRLAVSAARRRIEIEINRILARRQFDVAFDRVPSSRYLRVPVVPLASVDSITSYDENSTPTVMSTGDYWVDTLSEPGRIVLTPSASWPSGLRQQNGLVVRVTAGAEYAPEPLAAAVGQLAAFLFEHRGDAPVDLPPGLADLCDRYVVPDVA